MKRNMLRRYIFVYALVLTSAAVILERNYGAYMIKVLSYTVQNYKPFAKVTASLQRFDNGSSTLTFHSIVSKEIGVLGIKVRWYAWDESLKKFSQAINIVMRNVCEKQLAKEILGMVPGLGKDCKVKTGDHHFTIADLNGLMHSLTNDKFFYGTFRSVTDVFTDKYGRFMKINLTISVDPN